MSRTVSAAAQPGQNSAKPWKAFPHDTVHLGTIETANPTTQVTPCTSMIYFEINEESHRPRKSVDIRNGLSRHSVLDSIGRVTRLPLALCTPTLGRDGVKRRWMKGAEVLGALVVDVLSGLANSLREQSRKSSDTHRNSLQLENPIVLAFILSTVWLAHLVFI
ncbi:hypothetical protein I7I51_02142 [Histoplasma capsulatum]|uniref:Uncharacterized protein n=1 Tax=Ajellomyces capsulatus TaxID=5037 RepID=A0A8A1M9G2_AJECA|nr:hypothetical protein I7I51_02142 [Histoplasma capsulatum]